MKRLFALLLAVVMVVGMMAACGKKDKGDKLTESPLPAKEITKDFEIKADFKIGFICLHDEKSTYDKNFIDAAEEAIEALGLTKDQYIIKTNVPEGKECYEAAADLVDQGCKVVFANSFGHEDFMLQAAKEFPNVEFCHATGFKAHLENVANRYDRTHRERCKLPQRICFHLRGPLPGRYCCRYEAERDDQGQEDHR